MSQLKCNPLHYAIATLTSATTFNQKKLVAKLLWLPFLGLLLHFFGVAVDRKSCSGTTTILIRNRTEGLSHSALSFRKHCYQFRWCGWWWRWKIIIIITTRTGGTSTRHLHNAQPVIIDDVSTLERNNVIVPN